MRGVQALVFVEKTAATAERVVAVASVSQGALGARAARRLARGRLGARLSRRVSGSTFPPGPGRSRRTPTFLPDPRLIPDASAPVIRSRTGGLDAFAARQLVSRFIDSLQQPAPDPPTLPLPGWVVLEGNVLQERADSWVSRELLGELLPAEAFDAWAEAFRDAPRARRTRAVLRRAAPFVALVEQDRSFERLVNRRALLGRDRFVSRRGAGGSRVETDAPSGSCCKLRPLHDRDRPHGAMPLRPIGKEAP